jgi:AcrR family transcriptional regulator
MDPALKTKTAALRRAHILEAAREVFAGAGYQRATIRDIANAAGVSDGTIYNSFANKADLLLGLLAQLESGFTQPPPEAPPGDLVAARWQALTPEVFDLLRIALAEALADRGFGDTLRTGILDRATLPLEQQLAATGHLEPALAARCAVANVLGLALMRLLGDPLLAGEDVGPRLAALSGAAA